ncbi:MAG: hypothetical protein P4M09_19480 [Devosia sp.]|nr:hypothetical protein [Devosia sp.]
MIKALRVEGVSVEGAGQGAHGGASKIKLVMKRSVDQQLIARAIDANDHAATIILLNLEIEQQLIGFFEEIYGSKDFPKKYDALIVMLKAMRFDNDVHKIVDGFRRLRNKFAHEKGTDLGNCVDILDRIFSCQLPTFLEKKTESIVDEEGRSIRIADLPSINRLFVYANLTLIFLATVNQVYDFPRPRQRIVFAGRPATRSGS